MTRKLGWLGLLGSFGCVFVLAWGGRLAFGEPPSDKAIAEQILARMASAPTAPAPATSAPAASGAPASGASLTQAPLDEAKRALERAAGARQSGDTHHAELLEGLAREWAETARDVVRAAAVEADAGALEVAAADAGLRAERARALLEESISRRGRAEAELEKLTADGGLFPTQPAPSSSARPPKPAKGAR